ncbi:MAG: hypothetical protein LBU04_04500 [Christensenellaceae bacterium]|nr:hypothetical protein [Christensenellaceae bacterium]
MRIDCIENNKLLKNDEILITNRLTAEYLNAEKNDFRYLLQAPENYDGETDRYKGTTDIRVVSRDFFYDARDYFVI